jgi:hypothetical protein
MFEPNVSRLLTRLSPSDLVLDVGGCGCPFNRAQYVLDAQPFDSRGFYGKIGLTPSQGGEAEWFTPDTWVQRDICHHEPWPFPDKHFDFAICSQTLEDLRDPLWVCSELVRVAKAGYLEVPSRLVESTMAVERPHQAGLSHHRWLIEVSGSHVKFMQKYHAVHADWRFHLPPRFRKRLTPESSVTWLWWEGSFSFEEIECPGGVPGIERELQRFARLAMPSRDWLYRADTIRRRLTHFARRGWDDQKSSVVRWCKRCLARVFYSRS